MRVSQGVRVVLLSGALLLGTSERGNSQGPGGRGMGLIFATPEQLRGIPLASTPYSGRELPSSVDLSGDMPPPQDQGRQNSCAAWSVAYALKSYQERVEERAAIVTADGRIDARRVFSPAFVYNQINNGRDGGASLVDAFNLLRDRGAATWADMPYDPRDYQRRPDPKAVAAARRFRIDTWRQVNVQDTVEIKAHLQAGYPVVFGALTDDGLRDAGPGYVWNARRGNALGAHAMVLVGYDDARQAFKLMNSWGRQWGDGGYGWVSYQHFRRVTGEAYVAKDARNGPAPAGPDVEVPKPPAPTPPVEFAITSVAPLTMMPGRADLGYLMRIDGTMDIPPGVGTSDQVVISFWLDAGGGTKGTAVRSLSREYSTVYGQAACGTAVYPVPPEGLRGVAWAAWIPYQAMDLAAGNWVQTSGGPSYQPVTHALVAEPVLYVDNFGVKTGGLVRFTVTR